MCRPIGWGSVEAKILEGVHAERALRRGTAFVDGNGLIRERLRVVADSSVYISNFLNNDRGLSSALLELIQAQYRLYYSEYNIKEIESVLKTHGVARDALRDYLGRLPSLGVQVPYKKVECPECPDVDDLSILGTAVNASANILFARDRHLTRLRRFGCIEIINPCQLNLIQPH